MLKVKLYYNSSKTIKWKAPWTKVHCKSHYSLSQPDFFLFFLTIFCHKKAFIYKSSRTCVKFKCSSTEFYRATVTNFPLKIFIMYLKTRCSQYSRWIWEEKIKSTQTHRTNATLYTTDWKILTIFLKFKYLMLLFLLIIFCQPCLWVGLLEYFECSVKYVWNTMTPL